MKNDTLSSFCDCEFPDHRKLTNLKQNIPDMVKCRCGENDDFHRIDWTWRQQSESDSYINGPDVVFHPVFSQGTAGVRGAQELCVGMVHFWEIRMITALTGTDIIFGIGTEEVSFEPYKFKFVSGLGINTQSWGYSFQGYVQHNGKQQKYGRRFSQGSVLGVLLDRITGHLEFYLNRRPLGIAFNNIPLDPSVKLYPMMCSTVAKSTVRLINSISQADCLQLRAYRALTQSPPLMRELHDMPGLRSVLRTYWFFAPELYAHSGVNINNNLELADEALLSSTWARRPRKHKCRENMEHDDIDIYANMNKIFAVASDSEDEHFPHELIMDEYFDRFQ